MTTSSLECTVDVRISTDLFPNEYDFWTLWASHDCSDYTLLLTVVLSEEVMAKQLGW